MHTVPAEFAGEPAVLIEHNAKVRYSDEPDNSLWVYKTNHRIIKVLDEKGIESFNKMTVSIVPGEEMQTLKARTILPNGTINEVAKEKMKVMKGDDGNDEIVFAMDGVEKNAELELLIYYKKPAVLFGRETFQFMIPVVHATVELFG